jgi:hypothetical protein
MALSVARLYNFWMVGRWIGDELDRIW